jgi:hypothetical protein
MIKYLATCLVVTASVFAAGPGGPVPGYILDSRSAAIRPVYGIPGALQLGSPLNLPFGVISAAFGPAGDYVLAVNDQQPAHAFLIQSLAGVPTLSDLGVVADNTRILAVNASGSAALLYAGDGTAVQFVTGLPQSAAVSGPVATASLAGPITAAALDAAGACATVGTGSLETLCADGTSQQILSATGMNISAIVLANKEQDIIFADQAAKQIVLVRSSNATVLASASDGIAVPVGLQAVSSTQVLAADSGASAVFAIDPTGAQSLSVINLATAPTQLRPLADRSIVLLTNASAMPFTVMDLQSMQTFFIPTN